MAQLLMADFPQAGTGLLMGDRPAAAGDPLRDPTNDGFLADFHDALLKMEGRRDPLQTFHQQARARAIVKSYKASVDQAETQRLEHGKVL
jgi:hypothetical protein